MIQTIMRARRRRPDRRVQPRTARRTGPRHRGRQRSVTRVGAQHLGGHAGRPVRAPGCRRRPNGALASPTSCSTRSILPRPCGCGRCWGTPPYSLDVGRAIDYYDRFEHAAMIVTAADLGGLLARRPRRAHRDPAPGRRRHAAGAVRTPRGQGRPRGRPSGGDRADARRRTQPPDPAGRPRRRSAATGCAPGSRSWHRCPAVGIRAVSRGGSPRCSASPCWSWPTNRSRRSPRLPTTASIPRGRGLVRWRPALSVFISVDMEGIAGITTVRQCRRGTDDYSWARELMTDEANAAIAGGVRRCGPQGGGQRFARRHGQPAAPPPRSTRRPRARNAEGAVQHDDRHRGGVLMRRVHRLPRRCGHVRGDPGPHLHRVLHRPAGQR